MKLKTFILTIILSTQAFAKLEYGLGFESGINQLSAYQAESTKSGASIGVKLFTNYRQESNRFQASLGYQNMQLAGNGVKIITKSVYGELEANRVLSNKVELGLGLKFMGGTDNTNSENVGQTTINQSLFGKLNYQTDWFQNNTRAFLAYQRSYNLDRPISTLMVGVDIPFSSEKKVVKAEPCFATLKVNLNITHVKFSKNKFQLRPEDKQKLAKLALFLRKYNNSWERVKIMGHTDLTGDEDYNRSLSMDRADEVLKALIESGVDESKMTTSGYGSSIPLNEARNESAYAQNRRVEIEFYGVNHRAEFNQGLIEILGNQ